jgi:hypothetical protein
MAAPAKALPKSLRQINALADDMRHSVHEQGQKSQPKSKTEKSFAANEVPYAQLQTLYQDLLDRYKNSVEQRDDAVATSKRRQDAYLRKELQYREQLGSLEDRIRKATLDDPNGDTRMSTIVGMHDKIQKRIGDIQGQTTKVLQEQERDLIRAFRARLLDVTNELDKERKKNESGSVEWVAKCRKLTEELEWFRENTDKLTAENKRLMKENRASKRQLKTQEEDREFLIKQLVSVKKENARLRYSFEQANFSDQEQERIGLLPDALGGSKRQTLGGSSSIPKLGMSSMSQTLNLGSMGRSNTSRGQSRPDSAMTTSRVYAHMGEEKRFTDHIAKLQKKVAIESRKAKRLQTALTTELQGKSELQTFLKKCIEDVRNDIAQRKMSNRKARGLRGKAPIDPRTIPLEDFTPADRINVMEWLLSQDHVIYLIYSKLFPTQ